MIEEMGRDGRPMDIFSLGCIFEKLFFGENARLLSVDEIKEAIESTNYYYSLHLAQSLQYQPAPSPDDHSKSALIYYMVHIDPKQRPTVDQLINYFQNGVWIKPDVASYWRSQTGRLNLRQRVN